MQIAMIGLGRRGVAAPLRTAALYSRFAGRGGELFADEVESAQRFEFGGHREKTS
jgi:6-phosphogluconate dehydrogenase